MGLINMHDETPSVRNGNFDIEQGFQPGVTVNLSYLLTDSRDMKEDSFLKLSSSLLKMLLTLYTGSHTVGLEYIIELPGIQAEVKVKLSLCFNREPRHEGILIEWRYSSTHSCPRH
jgi:hypothetical protein